MKEKVTLATLARELNTTPATVSKVLSGKNDVGPKMAEKVRELARRRNYTPNIAARKLQAGIIDSIGVLITSDITNPWYSQLVSYLEEKLSERGQTMLLSLGKSNETKKHRCLQNFQGGRVGGVIVGPIFRTPEFDSLRDLLDCGLPLVMFNCLNEYPVNYVAIDTKEGAKMAVNHLIDCGHRRIAYLCCAIGDMRDSLGSRRIGFEEALRERNILYDASCIIQSGEVSKKGGYLAMKKLLQNRDKNFPTAFFCHNDNVALGALLAIQQAGLSVPEDISLIGFDDIEESVMSYPALSTVGGVMHELANNLIDTLFQVIKAPSAEPIRRSIKPQLLLRDSIRILNSKKKNKVKESTV